MFSTFLAILITNTQPQPKPIITPGNSIARKCSRPGGGRACEPRLAGLNNPTQTTVDGADTGFLAGFVPQCPKEGCQNPTITEGSGTR